MSEAEFEFKTETQKLLKIIINSLYKNREIFLRELISNASDALNKIRLKQLTNEEVFEPEAELEIELIINKEDKTLTIRDTGIGMTKDELITNLGTIAQSGTEEFIKSLEEGANSDLIGQFGVGFYSAFLVADKVKVISRSYKPDSKAYEWVSTGDRTFSVAESEKEHRGTDVILYMHEFEDEEDNYLEEYKIKQIIKQYSNYVEFPIKLNDEVINDQQALWRTNPKEVKDEQYEEFYHHLGQFGKPLSKVHVIVDNPYQFFALLYIPETRPRLFGQNENDWGLRLYNRKVLIDEKNKDILPEYLRFITGVVDAEDFDLNVSREVVQTTRVQRQMTNYLHKKIIDEFEKLAKDDEDKYMQFYREFGAFLKEGVAQNTKFKDRLLELLRFYSTAEDGNDGKVSLSQYIERMKPDQKEIYYLTGLDIDILKNSPHLEYYKENDLEVLLMGEAIDSFLMMNLHEYHDKKFFLIDQDEDNGEEEETKDENEDKDNDEEKEKEKTGEFAPLLNRALKVLKGKIVDAKTSDRMVNSAVRLVTSKGGISSDLQRAMRIMESQSSTTKMSNFMMSKVLQFNPKHEIVIKLNNIIKNDPDNEIIDLIIHQLHDSARIIEGDLPDFNKMISRVEKIIKISLNDQ